MRFQIASVVDFCVLEIFADPPPVFFVIETRTSLYARTYSTLSVLKACSV